MSKYIGINIGPVVKTLSLARRPRELWAASYLFSYLMKCIVEEAENKGGLIAPAKVSGESDLKVGLYPDRLYLRPNDQNNNELAADILKIAWENFRKNVSSQEYEEPHENKALRGIWLYDEYFNLMHTSCEADSEVVAVKTLNRQLDLLELCVMASNTTDKYDPQGQVLKLLQRTNNSSLFYLATGKPEFPVESLAEIAAAQLQTKVSEKWNDFVSLAKSENDKTNPYSVFENKHNSYHRYFCVVQSDGDNMGKTLTDISLADGSISKISSALVKFGKKAVTLISEFGGMPIYAGGDDLLFLAPVVGKDNKHIFELLESLDSDAFCQVRDVCKKVQPSLDSIDLPTLSFGVSISFYKHPLYEALETARTLLFDVAKNVPGKKAIAWKLEKHSGESFEACYSRKEKELDDAVKGVINVTDDGQIVTQTLHKSKCNWKLLTMCLESENRFLLDSFFKTTLEETLQNKAYFDALKILMRTLFDVKKPSDDEQMKAYVESLYSILRTAKFIKGEDPKDE